jgi:hypothetical protein
MAQMTSVDRDSAPTSNWAVGFTIFAACMMVLIGSFQAIQGLAAIFEDEFFVVTRDYVYGFDVTAWGWIHLILGIIVMSCGIGLFGGSVWARTGGVIAAILSGIANFLFLPYYPVWSMLIIAVDVAVIWALTAHGRDIAR